MAMEEKATLTQRRAISGAAKLDKTKLSSLGSNKKEDGESSGSPAKNCHLDNYCSCTCGSSLFRSYSTYKHR